MTTDMNCLNYSTPINGRCTQHGNSVGSVIEIICDEGYLIYNLGTRAVNTTCTIDDTGDYAHWCWVPPCEGKLKMIPSEL